jgi:alpha-tubulin suppressor-like RCC1 family protein
LHFLSHLPLACLTFLVRPTNQCVILLAVNRPRLVQAEMGSKHGIMLDDHGRVHTWGRGNTGGHEGLPQLGNNE